MSNDLLKYKNEFAIKFALLMQEKLLKWKRLQNECKKELYSFGAILFYLGVGLFGFIPLGGEVIYQVYRLGLHCIVVGFLCLAGIISNIFVVNKKYQRRIKQSLFPELLKIFQQNIVYDNDDENSSYKIPDNIFNNSKLYNQRIAERTDDDIFYGDYKGVDFTMNETDFGYITSNSKGNNVYNRLFKGLAMRFTMNKKINSRVIIVPKNFFSLAPREYEEVKIEDIKFSKKYKVYVSRAFDGTTGQIEARYLLNTLFINRFMQLQTSFKVNKIACSVMGNQMLVMLSTGKDLFEMNHLFGKIDDTSQYQHLFDEFASVFSFIDVLNVSSKTNL